MTAVADQSMEIFDSLVALAGDLTDLPDAIKSKAGGYMDLHMDRLIEERGKTVIALAHYFHQNGDSVCDPDIEIAIYTEEGRAEALTYQDQHCYRCVYDDEGNRDGALSNDLNGFLLFWLSNLLEQGHSLSQ